MSKIEQLRAEYNAHMHAVQTGVALDHSRGSEDGTPKHLRVGVNSAMVSIHALSVLLIAKGVFTEEEYTQAVVDSAKAEKERYEALLGLGSVLV